MPELAKKIVLSVLVFSSVSVGIHADRWAQAGSPMVTYNSECGSEGNHCDWEEVEEYYWTDYREECWNEACDMEEVGEFIDTASFANSIPERSREAQRGRTTFLGYTSWHSRKYEYGGHRLVSGLWHNFGESQQEGLENEVQEFTREKGYSWYEPAVR